MLILNGYPFDFDFVECTDWSFTYAANSVAHMMHERQRERKREMANIELNFHLLHACVKGDWDTPKKRLH